MDLPFKIGQLAESKSFVSGYRGAWFRCKIKDIRQRSGDLHYMVEYYDFPDEKVRSTKLYQKYSKTKELTLMVRPQFPQCYCGSQLPNINSNSGEEVVLHDVWKVGALVDWFSDGCYWSGWLTEAIDDENFKIDLFPPPDGEGSSYEASCKDLRPSLDWSPDNGWTVPVPTGSEGHRPFARIVKPVNLGSSVNLTVHTVDEGRKNCDASVSSHVSASHSLPQDTSDQVAKGHFSSIAHVESQLAESTTVCMETQPVENTAACVETQPVESSTACMESTTPCVETQPVKINNTPCVETQPVKINKDLHVTDGGVGKTSCSDSASSLRPGDASAEVAGNTVGNDGNLDNAPSTEMRTDISITLNSTSSDAIEAAIVDLEELVIRLKWIKDILKFGIPLPDAVQPSWEFVEHRSSSLPK